MTTKSKYRKVDLRLKSIMGVKEGQQLMIKASNYQNDRVFKM